MHLNFINILMKGLYIIKEPDIRALYTFRDYK